ncbi:MAG TPA: VIT domain-containing protein [Kofleriaceae bacterium]|nr:VIT domain-containing protein [Kofleriaceae bacterium]
MLRPALAVTIAIAASATAARANSLPRHLGMYSKPSAPLAMLDSDVAVIVRGPIVEATVTQTFRNDRDHVTEATYVFPLPPDAAVSAMAIETGGRTIHASIAPRAEAQRRYEDAVAAGLGAGLLDEDRPDVFTQTVAAIPAHGTVKVTLRFDTVARYASGTWQLVLPLVVAPRYVPGVASGRPTTGTGRSPDTDRAPDASRVTPTGAPGAGGATAIAIEFVDAVDDVASPSHELVRDLGRYKLVDAKSDHDAIVTWRARVPAEGWVEQDDDGGYAAVVVAAPAAAAATPPLASLLVVLDRSATTRGDADAVEHPLVRALLGAVSASGHVAVAGSDRIAPGTPERVQKQLDDAWPHAPGAFDLTRVLEHLRTDGAAVVLVSDGLVADDRAALAAARRVGAPLHVIGVGPAPNRSLLEGLAAATGGTIRFAVPGDDLAAAARDVLADAATPPAPLAVTWGALVASDVEPVVAPRLGAGQAALVVARVKKAERANARVRGDVLALAAFTVGQPPLGATTPLGPLARRWARMKLDELVAAGSTPAIAAHAMRYGLVSPATSMIAVGDEVVVAGGVKHTVSVPVSVPAGMRWQHVRRELAGEDQDKAAEQPVAKAPSPKKSSPSTGREHASHEPAPAPAPAQPTATPPPQPARPTSPPAEAKAADETGADDEGDDAVTRKKKRVTSDADSGGYSPKTETVTAAAAPPPEAAGEPAEADVVTEGFSARSVRRLSLALATGLAVEHGSTDYLAALAARYEVGGRTLIGGEASLWLVGGSASGTLLGTVGRHVGARLELRGGIGLHLGDELGPALDLAVRARLPVPHLGAFLRYDGALLFHDSTHDGQNAATIGIEASF